MTARKEARPLARSGVTQQSGTETHRSCDAEQIAEWLKVLVEHDSTVELRILFEKGEPLVRHYSSNDLMTLANDAIRLGKGAKGVYFLLNPLPAEWSGEPAKDADIVRRRLLLIDCDPQRKGTVSSTDEEKDAARQKMVEVDSFLAEHGWPAPIVADSGNGWHLVFPIDLPADDGGLVHRVLKVLASMFDDAAVSIDTKVGNASRICKLYGTLAAKGENTIDRPHRVSKIITIPSLLEIVPIEMLQRLASESEKPQQQPVQLMARICDAGHASRSEAIEQARKYLAAMEPSIEGQHGSDRLIKAASVLVNDFSLTDGEASDLLMVEFNPRCVPPWPEHEVLRKIGEAKKNPPSRPAKGPGTATTATRAPRTNGQPRSEPEEGGEHSASSSPPRKPPPMLSVRDLIGGFNNMRKPIIYGLLREGETMNIIAASKVGKSWLATNLALTFATRRKWLGRFDTAGGNVLIVDNELHQETSAYRIPAVADANSIPLNEYADHVFVMNLRGELVSLPQLAVTLDAIEPGRFKLIILDAFYRFLPPGVDENDNGAMAQLYNLLDRVAAKLKCAFVCIHHASKGSQSAKAVTDVGSGAGSMSRAADCHVVLRPHEESNVVVMEVATRSWPPLQPLCLRWRFPIFEPDDTLDPALLRPDRPRRPARTETEKTPAEPAWTHQRFAQEFCATTPQTRDAILAKVADAGLSARSAERLFRMAEGAGLIHSWPNVKKRQPGYATVQPPSPEVNERVDSARAPPHPPNTKPQKRRVGVGECVRVGKRKAKAFGNRDR